MAKKAPLPAVKFEVGDQVCWNDKTVSAWVYGQIQKINQGFADIKVCKDSPHFQGAKVGIVCSLLHFDNRPVKVKGKKAEVAKAKKAKAAPKVPTLRPKAPAIAKAQNVEVGPRKLKALQKAGAVKVGMTPAQKAWETIRARKAAAQQALAA